MKGRQCVILVSEERSRGKLSAGLGARGVENKMRECYAAKKMFAKSLLEDSATALKTGQKLDTVGQTSATCDDGSG